MASYSALSIAFSSSYMQIFKFNGKSIYNGNKFYSISLHSAADPLSFQHMCTFSLKSTFTFHVARLNVYEMFHNLTILKMCLKRNKNAHNDPYITIKRRTIRTRSPFAHTKKKTNYLWRIVSVCACAFRFELLQFQSLLCSFISFSFRLFCCARGNYDATEICIQFILSQCQYCRFALFVVSVSMAFSSMGFDNARAHTHIHTTHE